MTLRMLKEQAVQQKAAKKKASSGGGREEIVLKTLKPDPGLPKGYLSKSAIEMYLRCPQQYYRRYIKGIKEPPGVALVEGSAHGEALNFNNLTYIKSKSNLPVRVVVEKFCDEFSTRSREVPKQDWIQTGQTKDKVIARGKLLLPNYFKAWGNIIRPISVEEYIEVSMGGVPVVGYIDVDTEERIWDYKVVGKMKSQGEADTDIQLSIYSRAKKKRQVGFMCLTKTANAVVGGVTSKRTNGDWTAADELIKSVADAIKKGAFPMCHPGGWNCSSRFCGFWSDCRGKYLGNGR